MDAVDAVAFTAATQADPFFAAGVFPPGLPVYQVPESSTEFTPGHRDRARQETGLHGDPCLVWVGHLDQNKDPITVLEGFAVAAPHLPDPRLWLCYRNAPLLDRVEAAVEARPSIRGRVHLLGEQPHERVETLLRAGDALVSGSRREGSGYAVIEALACGATPIITDIPSFRRLAGAVGRLWEPGEARSLAAALVDLGADLGDPARRDRVRRHFEANLSWDVVGGRLADIYAGLVGDPGSRRAAAG